MKAPMTPATAGLQAMLQVEPSACETKLYTSPRPAPAPTPSANLPFPWRRLMSVRCRGNGKDSTDSAGA